MRSPVFFIIYKSFHEDSSYKFSFFIKTAKIFFILLVFFYISKTIVFKDNYKHYPFFEFIFSGHLFYEFVIKNIKIAPSFIIAELYKGTLELLFNSKISPIKILFYSTIYPTIWSYIYILIYIIVGKIFFKIEIILNFKTIILSHLLIFSALLIVYFWSIIGSAITLIIKKGDPLTSSIIYFSILAGGIYFPKDQLPTFINYLHYIFPIPKVIETIRELIFLNKISFTIFIEIIINIFILSIISTFIFKKVLNYVKKDNGLVTY